MYKLNCLSEFYWEITKGNKVVKFIEKTEDNDKSKVLRILNRMNRKVKK